MAYGSGPVVELQVAGTNVQSTWNAMVSAGSAAPHGRRYVVVDARSITTQELATALAAAAHDDFDDFDVYLVDDTPTIEDPEAFGEYGCVYDFFRDAPGIQRRPDRRAGVYTVG